MGLGNMNLGIKKGGEKLGIQDEKKLLWIH